jgi:hypothetical protein
LIGGPSRTRTLDPLIKSRGAVTSRPSVFLLTSAQLPDEARAPTGVVHDTSAVSRHQNSRRHAPECIGSLKITQVDRARAADYSTVRSVRQRLPDHANHSSGFSLFVSHPGSGSGLNRRHQDFQSEPGGPEGGPHSASFVLIWGIPPPPPPRRHRSEHVPPHETGHVRGKSAHL